MSAARSDTPVEFTANAPEKSNVRWFVCLLLFLATTINYMDRSVLSLIEPLLHVPFMGWVPGVSFKYQTAYNLNYGHIVECFQYAYAVGFLVAAPFIDRLGTKIGYAIAIGVWALASLSHALVGSVLGFCIARIFLGLGESGNFPAAIKATSEWFPSEERALSVGLFNSGANAAFFIVPALVPLVTLRFGWRAAFICTSSMGLLWLIVWLIFPYNRLRRGLTTTQAKLQRVVPDVRGWALYKILLRTRGLYAFAIAKGLTDPIWWFYLFYLPKFLDDNYGLGVAQIYWPIVVVYAVSSVGSFLGGWLSGMRMKRGHTVNSGRKFAMFVMAVCVVPLLLVPHMHVLFPHNAWPAIGLFSLAAAAHQGWSANLFTTPTDMFPSTSVSTVVGIGGAVGSIGGALFTILVSHLLSLHPLVIFVLAAFAYLLALGIFQLLVPRLGAPSEPEIPLSTT
ncbi:MAG TPA: MFS transporter [Acidobacteriaceae bacterium]|jgi:ACS family hexuronate transporter-like MFS transporter|nr:MFS transporter [Acidobacteriaceae bacterium]